MDLGILPASDILEYWRSREKSFPILAQMTRDFLSVPASGVGVERLFNSSRDVCHYRRSRLASDTIHSIMLQMCTDRFILKQEFADIAEDIKNDEDDWNLLSKKENDRCPQYISDDELESDDLENIDTTEY